MSGLQDRLLHEGELSALYQYDPMRRYFEVGEDDTLVLTSDAGLPLIRYNTRDRGGVIPYADIAPIVSSDLKRSSMALDVKKWRLPLVYLFGRRDLSISLYALNIYVENIKQALDTWHESEYLSGLFTMRVGHTRDLNQQFEIVIELARGVEPSSAMGRQIAGHTVATLRKVNTEYAKLHATVGRRALPKVRLVRYGEIETMPGRKHKWVRRG
jgi:phenylacetate-CoA ligase